ncbi:MAG: hypothetical protein RIB93_09580 [Coleofasciculus sp. D1-CHI-01]|uniref:hypothetical protein n=1 Tax=Coleofasciculus sp. D1-CHI-01 TaxID=3068482 RepID=UPI0032F3D3A7
MVILEKTPTQLKLRHRPYFIWQLSGCLVVSVPLLIILVSLVLPWIVYMLGLYALFAFNIVLSIVLLVCAGRIFIYHFDKDTNSLLIKRRGLLKTQVTLYPLSDIFQVQLKSTSWNQDRTSNYQIAIILKSGKHLSIKSEGKTLQQKLEIVNLIRRFLDMPPQKLAD